MALPALSHTSLPVFEAHVDRIPDVPGGRPRYVYVRPIRVAGSQVRIEEIFEMIADQLQRAVYRYVGEYRPFTIHPKSRAWMDEHIKGTMQMNNIEDNGAKAHTKDVGIDEIDSDMIQELFERATAQGSNPDLDFYEVEWTFLIHANTIDFGAARRYKNYLDLKGLVPYEWPLDEQMPCGVIAFVQGYLKHHPKYQCLKPTSKKYEQNMILLCREFKENYKLTGMDMTFDQVGSLIKHLPGWRLVILQPVVDLNGFSYESESFKDGENTMFMYHDQQQSHYVYCKAPQSWFQSYYGSKNNLDPKIRFCKLCLKMYRANGSENAKCSCKGAIIKGQKYDKQLQCNDCGKTYWKKNGHKDCYSVQCKTCKLFHKRRDGKWSRCAILPSGKSTKAKKILGKDEEDITDETNDKDEKYYDLIAWDIESASFLVDDRETTCFKHDRDGNFIKGSDGKFITYTRQRTTQIPNLICTQSVYTGEKNKFSNLKEFLQWATCTHNDGNNIFVAHNSSGYDSRLLFEEGMRFDQNVTPTMNGGRIMSMKIGNAKFIDSMLHLQGSLAALAKGFGVKALKGYFPHLMNQEANYNYRGPLPDRDMFDLSFSVKSQKDLDDFNQWYDSWEGEWVFQDELLKYCENDVYILATIMQKYSDTYTDLIGAKFPHLNFSPWFSATCAGYVHDLFLNHIHHQVDFENMDREDFDEYVQNTWAVLEAEEYYFCKLALRGGSTNIYCYKYDGKIRYKDIQSSYPSVQLEHEYPVGTPKIHVFEKGYYPCADHSSTPEKDCGCVHEWRVKQQRPMLDILYHDEELDTVEWVKNRFGFAMVDLQPPSNLYCPPLIRYDAEKKKCMESLEFIERQVITSEELKVALEYGYTLMRLYRFDEYRKAPSMWRELLGHMYVLKMRYSQKPPSPEDQVRLRKTFMERFGIELDDMDKWEKNPVLKKICKGPPTSAWGKHAETVDHPQSRVIDENNPKGGYDFFTSIQMNQMKVTSFKVFPTKTLFKYEENRNSQRPNCHRGYLPCAVFVTAYGRLKLWREKQQLGKRVLMCDTDSIIYADDPEGYDIPEGDVLGDWETEDFEKDNGGIIGFRSCGPKSYALKAANGVEYTKCKGVSLKRAHESLINFDVMDKMVSGNLKVDVPQFTMDYIPTEGIYTRQFIKQVGFNKAFIKGIYKEKEYRVYPYGYKE